MKNNTIFLMTRVLISTVLALTISNGYAYDPKRIPRPYSTGYSDPLPEGWKFRDIGNIAPATDWCYKASDGSYYLKAYGESLRWNHNNDQCGFLYTESDQDVQLEVRIMDAEKVDGSYAVGGLMIRAGMANDDPMIFLEAGSMNKISVTHFCRSVIGGTDGSSSIIGTYNCGTVGSTHTPPDCYPRWLRLVREGRYVTPYQKDDYEGAPWVQVGSVRRLAMTGKAYLGITACAELKNKAYNGDRTKPAIFKFDNLSVTDIVIPYEALYPESVSTSFYEYVTPGNSRNIDITKVFGHALGEYFTIECESADPTVAEAYCWEKPVEDPKDGEEFRKYVCVKGIREGVTSLKLTCTIKGFTMRADYAVGVSKGKAKPKDAKATAPFGWTLKSLEIPVNPEIVWGEEFVKKDLLISKRIPSFLGSWEYDWGGYDVGNHAKTPGNNPPTNEPKSEMYVRNAGTYTFRDEMVPYTKADKFAKDTIRSEVGGASGSSVDLAFVGSNTYDDLVFRGVVDSLEGINWELSRGLYTRYISQKGFDGRAGFPYITNIKASDWISYTVYAPRSGYYRISPVAACRDEHKSLRVDVNGITQIKELAIKKGMGGADWKEGAREMIFLTQGRNHLKFVSNSMDYNLLGFRILFASAVKVPYSGLTFDAEKYFQPEVLIDTSLMAEDEKITYDSIQKVYDTSTLKQRIRMDSTLLLYPKKTIYDTAAILNRYSPQLDSMNIPYRTQSEKLVALDSVTYRLTHAIDTMTFFTTQQSPMKHIDVTSYLYKTGYDPTKPIEISMKIDTVANTGKGTYLGLMMRSLLDGEVSPNSPYASFGVGSYEGGRFSYRWAFNYDYKKFDNEDIAQDVYLKVRLNFYAQDYMTAYYSYDGNFWWEYLEDPIKVGFLSAGGVDRDIAIGMYLTGGDFTGDICLATAKASNFTVKQYENMEEFERQYAPEEMINYPLSISKTTIRGDEPVDITYNVCKPGQVSLKVFDAYGMLKEVIMDGDKPFSKEPIVRTHVFTNLTESGIYLLQLNGPNNEQYLRFRYIAE